MKLFSLSSNQTFYLKNILVFTLFFLAIWFNMALIPSVMNNKSHNIQGFKSLLGMVAERKSECDSECANQCLFTGKEVISEEQFKTCISNCNCEYIAKENTQPDSFLLSLCLSLIAPLKEHYFFFCIFFALSAFFYLNYDGIKYFTIKTLSKYSLQIKEYIPLSNDDSEKYEKLLQQDE